MTSQSNIEYKTTVADEHWRNEELQWARILSSGSPARGMVLLYIQKACTAFHEFEPAWKEGVLKQERVDFFRRRLANRVRHVLVTMENNGLDTINGAAELAEILRSIESAKTADELAELTEKVHAVNHLLLDSLEKKQQRR
jgi:2-iminoacetate synthase ThiH